MTTATEKRILLAARRWHSYLNSSVVLWPKVQQIIEDFHKACAADAAAKKQRRK